MANKTLPQIGDTNWATPLNDYLSQLTDNTNGGGINKFSQFSSRPTNLTANDAGKTYIYTQTGNIHQWTGSAWVVLNDSVINVKDYGAIGDGVSDDTVAIQAAINLSFQIVSGNGTIIFGREVFIPTGKYIIGNLKIYESTCLRGVTAGLASAPNNQNSAGSVLVLKPEQNLLMFECVGGGPIQMTNINFVGNGGEVSGTKFITSGKLNDNSGITQGMFFNCRFFAFSTVFDCYKMFDAKFESCGFEANLVVFKSGYSVNSQGGINSNYFSNCVFYENYLNISLANQSSFMDNLFVNCFFYSTNRKSLLSNSSSSNVSFARNKFNTCNFSFDQVIPAIAFDEVANFEDNIFSNCTFNKSSITFYFKSDSVSNLKNLILSNCTFILSNITIEYEMDGLSISNSNFNNSIINISGGKNLSIIGNKFSRDLATIIAKDVTLIDSMSEIIITNNIFNQTKGGVNFQNKAISSNFLINNNINEIAIV